MDAMSAKSFCELAIAEALAELEARTGGRVDSVSVVDLDVSTCAGPDTRRMVVVDLRLPGGWLRRDPT